MNDHSSYNREYKTPPDRDRDELEEQIDIKQYTPQLKPPKRWPKIVFSLILVIIIAGIAFYVWLRPYKPASPPATPKHAKTSTSYQAPPTTQYYSNSLNISFNYPKSWSVNDTGNNKLIVTSTPLSLTNASGKTVTGQVIVTMQNQPGATVSGFSGGNALAVLPSTILVYSSPSTGQAAQTYLSFLQYSTTTATGGLDAIYVTGNYGYQGDQYVQESDIAQVDPLVVVSFDGCSDKTCNNTSPLTISATMWSAKAFAQPIKNLLASLNLND